LAKQLHELLEKFDITKNKIVMWRMKGPIGHFKPMHWNICFLVRHWAW
jgi:hypothetical protein